MNDSALMASSAIRSPLIRQDRCELCKFSARVGRGFTCHRMPPATTILVNPKGRPEPVSAFALVQGDNWCGEWRPKIEMTQ